MPHVQRQLTRAWNWNAQIGECHTPEAEMAFIQEALQQYENEYQHDGLRPSQVIVSDMGRDVQGDYMLNLHTIRIDYEPGKTRVAYMATMEHEHEHARQRLVNEKGGYQGEAGVMAMASLAVYPNKIYTHNGKLTHDYAYNYVELKATLAEAQWIHQYYHARMNSSPPDCFLPEKKEILQELKDMQATIKGRPSTLDALATNSRNARKIFWGKYNDAYMPIGGKLKMSHFMRTAGRRMIKETMRELKAIEKELKKDIKELEKLVSPQHEQETRRAEQQAMSEYMYDQAREANVEAAAKGFERVTDYPNDRAYSVTELANVRLLNYYMHAFPADAQNDPSIQSGLKWMECADGSFKVFVPKELIQGKEIDTTSVEREALASAAKDLEIEDTSLDDNEHDSL